MLVPVPVPVTIAVIAIGVVVPMPGVPAMPVAVVTGGHRRCQRDGRRERGP
jgi:hypothetical protein